MARIKVFDKISGSWVYADKSFGKDGKTPVKGVDYFDGKDYVLTDADKYEIAETVKTEVPLVKVAEQPSFVSSVEEMTDTSKIYVKPDMSMWAWMKGEIKALTESDFVATSMEANGSYNLGDSLNSHNRIVTKDLLPLSSKISISCPSGYQYFVYYYTDNTVESFIGKTTWKNGDIDDVSNDVVASGTKDGATYCRISLRASDNASVDLSGRIAEFMSRISITQGSTAKKWADTGYRYNQPANYEDRIVALEKALEGIENGTY